MKRVTFLGGMFFSALRNFEDLSLLISISQKRLESIYFKKLFRTNLSETSLTDFPIKLPENFKPVFVLSTGRCGTLTLTNLMKLCPTIQAYHEPHPNFVTTSYFYFNKIGPDLHKDFWYELIKHARGSLMLRTYWLDRVYFESNNRLALFADLLIEMFPQSKLIHVVRNPFDFIRSAIKKGYYKNNSWDFARIKPQINDELYKVWSEIKRIEKCAWLWKETNKHIINVLENVSERNKIFIKAEDIFKCNYEQIERVYRFANENVRIPSTRKIKRILKKKYNLSINSDNLRMKNWGNDEMNSILKQTSDLMKKFGYAI